VIAARLSENPARSVCLVEAGPDPGPLEAGGWPAELLDARTMTDEYDWRDDERRLGAARVLGGSSAVNACAWMRPPAEDLRGWADDLGPFLDRAEETVAPRHFAAEEEHPWWRAVMEAANELGMSAGTYVNDPDAVDGACRIPLDVRGTTRWNAALAYLDAARGRPNLTIRQGTVVDRVTFSGTRATGARVLAGGTAEAIEAGAVIVSCGAYGSPAVLQRSGIGPEQLLRAHGVEPLQPLPAGEGLAEHFGVLVRLEPSDELVAATDAFAQANDLFIAHGIVKASTDAGAGPWDLHLLPMLLPAGSGRVEGTAQKPYTLGLTAMVLQAEWRGHVRIGSADPERVPDVTPVGFDRERDVTAAVEGLNLARALAATASGRAATAQELVPGDAVAGDDAVRGYMQSEPPSRYFHPVATCAAGRVTDGVGSVLGVDDLLVADASVIPRPLRVGPCWTVMAIGERAAAHLG
jgi:choline dehydrogenase